MPTPLRLLLLQLHLLAPLLVKDQLPPISWFILFPLVIGPKAMLRYKLPP